MKIKILWLYKNLMNLYGSRGNVLCLARHMKEAGLEVEIVEAEIGDEISFSDVDFVFMGAGTENSRDRALKDILKYKYEFKNYIENGGVCLFSGNSLELLSVGILKRNGEQLEGLGLYNFEVYETEKRTVVDTVCSCKFLNDKIIGFMNKQSITSFVPNPIFRVIKGAGNAPDRNDEGIFDKNLYATELSGPILVRNPHLCAHIEKAIYRNKNLSIVPQGFAYEQMAYNKSLSGLLN